jgi:hypothetical protein
MESCRVIGSAGRWSVLVALLAAAAVTRGYGQTDSRLAAVVKLAQDGQSDSARAVVRRLLDAAAPTDSLYPEILYTTGLVAETDADRRLALRRVIIEFSQSDWADDALLLLGQTEYAGGNPGATVTQIEKLVGDYPTSPLIPAGALWGARAASDVGNPAAACRLADAGLAAATEDVEVRNQLEFQKQRCSAMVLAKAADTGRPAAPPVDTSKTTKPIAPPVEPAAAVKPPPKGSFGVQIVAAPTRAKADEALASLKRAGFEAFLVTEGGLFKVRAGPYATRAAAQAALPRVRSRLGGSPFIVANK